MVLQFRQDLGHRLVHLQRSLCDQPHQDVGRHGHFGDARHIVHRFRGHRSHAVQRAKGLVHDNVPLMRHHHAGSRKGAFFEGHVQEAVHLGRRRSPKASPLFRPSSQPLVSAPRQTVAHLPWTLGGRDGQRTLHCSHPHEGVGHSLAGARVVLVGHKQGARTGRQGHQILQCVGVAHPDHGHLVGRDAPGLKGLREGRHAFRLEAKVPRRPVAHFGGRHHNSVCLHGAFLDRIPAEAAAVFAEHMPVHCPAGSEMGRELGFQGRARGFMVGQVEHGQVAFRGQQRRGRQGIRSRECGQTLREQFPMDDVGMGWLPRCPSRGKAVLRLAPLLGQKHPSALLRDCGRIQGARGEGLHGFVDGGHRITRKEQHVVPGQHRVADAWSVAHEIGEAFHAHGVGEHESFEPEFAAQQAVHNQWRQGGGLGFGAVEARNVQVRHHDGPHAPVKRVSEGGEFHGIQTGAVVADGGKGLVRVAVAVPVAWEVLGGGQHVDVLQSVGVSLPQLANPMHIFAKAAASNHGVERVGVDVHHRGEIHMHPGGAKALPHHLAKQPHQLWIARGTQCHGAGERPRAVQAHPQPPLGVGRHHQGHLGLGLQPLQANALVLRAALHANDPAQPQLTGPAFGLRPTGGVGSRVNGNHEQLRHALFHAQGGQHAVHGEAVRRQERWTNGA